MCLSLGNTAVGTVWGEPVSEEFPVTGKIAGKFALSNQRILCALRLARGVARLVARAAKKWLNENRELFLA